MRFVQIFALAIVMPFLLTGCAAVHESAPNFRIMPKDSTGRPADHATKTLKTVVMNKQHELVKADEYGRVLYVSLRWLPGTLDGMPIDASPMLLRTRIGEDLLLPLADLENRLKPFAQPANADMLKSGMIVTPTETRFVRVGTFFQDIDPVSANMLFGAGFIDALTRQTVMLAYFDRACTVIGDVQENDLVISFSLTIPRAGMYWMRTDDANPKHWHIRLKNPDETLWYALIR